MKFVRGEPEMRLTVRLRKNDSRLHRYATWRNRLRSLQYARLWYVYQGIISPDRIIEIAGVNGDSETRKQLRLAA